MTVETHEHTHDHAPTQFRPQPVPMGVAVGLVTLEDGTDRIMVTLASVTKSA